MTVDFIITPKGEKKGQRCKGIITCNNNVVGIVKYRSVSGRKKNTKYPYKHILCQVKGPSILPWDYIVTIYKGVLAEAKKRFPADKDSFLYGNFTLEVSDTGEKNFIAW